MSENSVLVGDYLGCCGRVDFDAPDTRISYTCLPYPERPGRASSLAVQWVRPGSAAAAPPVPGPREHLLLTGVVNGPVSPAWTRRIAAALKEGRYADLAEVPGRLSGCLVTPRKVFLFRSAAAPEALLYRRDGASLRWSTDPADLFDGGLADLDRAALWRACRGDDVLVYPGLTPVLPGELVVADAAGTTRVTYDPIVPLDVPPRTSLAGYAELAYELIVEAVRPYARCGRVGILLSGGLDSSTVLAALTDVGADVVAYHMTTDDPLADESAYARAVCEHLGVPFVPVPTELGDCYLSREWRFPHPFVGYAYRWVDQLAERVGQDGITFLTWGSDGDVVFGPQRYGLHDVLFGDLRPAEKAALCKGLVSSRWELPRILRSVRRSSSLLEDYLPVGENARPVDFLVPLPGVPDDSFVEEYSPKDHTMDLTCWWPRGVHRCSPLGDKRVRRLTARMPNAYRLLPHQGRMISKPVLRLILSGRVPEQIWRRYGRLWQDSPHKRYAMTHPGVFAELLGGPDSRLAAAGIVDPAQLTEVLREPGALRRHSETLICSAMTELFLRGLDGAAPGGQPTKGDHDVRAAAG
ncbi:asparagine synthase-related protein [Actinomadura kijaniata]|uniref:asparagine synthase-related protein n=1 Tax=Actinomadura kijaniata TaxID=46161 RepID=UPI003F19CB67